MSDYKKGKIYKLWIFESDDIYIGSTTTSLTVRLNNHRCKSNNYSSKILFEQSNNVMIELIEEYPCDNKDQLTRREGELIRSLLCVNKRIAGRTHKEYRQENKEKIVERKKEYYQENKEKIYEKMKGYYQEHKVELAEKNKIYQQKHKEEITEQRKIYRQEHKVELAEKKKTYYQDHKEKITEYQKEYRQEHNEKVTCEICNCQVIKNNFKIHTRSKKHQGAVAGVGAVAGPPLCVSVVGVAVTA